MSTAEFSEMFKRSKIGREEQARLDQAFDPAAQEFDVSSPLPLPREAHLMKGSPQWGDLPNRA